MSNAEKPPVLSLINWPVYSLKVALATALAFVFVHVAQIDDPISATFVAAVCTSPTVVTGLKRAVEQMVGSFLGGAIAFAVLMACLEAPKSLGLLAGLNGAWVLGVAVGLAVLASGLLRLGQAHIVAAFSALYMVLMVEMGLNSPEQNLSLRLAAVAFGGLAAMIVNSMLSSLSYRGVFKRRLHIARQLVAGALLEVEANKDPSVLDEPLLLLSQLRKELGDAARERRLGFARQDPLISTYQQACTALYEIALMARCAKSHPDSSAAFARAAACLQGKSSDLGGEDPLSEELRRWEALMNGPGSPRG